VEEEKMQFVHLQAAGLEITAINDETPVPHNGCRAPKRPRN
jgi:small subunit ribosomal protein S11